MIFVDSNIPMYLVGAAHPNKELARRRIEELIVAGEGLVTDAEVLQEIMHRYVAIGRREAIEPAFDALLGIVDAVLHVELEDVQRARDLLATPSLQARDAIHIAIMQRHRIAKALTFDRAFDGVPGIARVA
ncbi:MAG: type II toxin-antitoxin system VapC family toxin [Chloroflexi bacterium]|nr:type II toxin-antitoxin system VapC family toxin [Chloroflexota bacterium]